jgi:hypothetical protein
MKIRNDFVTNSSSSSFVIAYKNVDNNQLLDKIIEALGGKFVITTKEELDKYYVDNYGWKDETLEEILDENDYRKDSYEEYLKSIQNGFKIYMNTVERDAIELICNLESINDENLIVKVEEC